MKKHLSIFATTILVMFGMSAFASKMTREFKVSPDPTLILRNIAGEIEVVPGTSNKIIVHVDRDSDDIEVDMFQSGNRVNIKVRYPSRNNYGNRGDVDFRIELPEQMDKLELGSVSGSIEVSGIQAEMDLKTVSGDISLKQCSGEMKLNAVSGDVDMIELGPAAIDASVISGDVVYRKANLEGGNYSFSSTSGSIRITHGASASYGISGRTISGSIRNSAGGTIEIKRAKYSGIESISGSYNGENVWIEAHSVSGDITIRKQ